MDTELLNSIIFGIPNFAGFTMAIIFAYARLKQQDELIKLLVQHWAECEDDEERAKLSQNLQGLPE